MRESGDPVERWALTLSISDMKTPITDIPGIGPATAEALVAGGFASAESIATSEIADLSSVPGFGPVRAARLIAAAIAIVPVKKSKPVAKKKVAKVKPKSKNTDKLKAKSSKKGKKKKK